MNNVESELIRATSFKPRKKYADRQEYLKSVINAVAKLDDDDFENLSDEAAAWCNAAIEVINTTKNGDVPDFDEINGADMSAEDDAEDADDEADEAEDEDTEDDGDEDDTDPEDDEGESGDDEDEPEPDEDEEVEPEPKESASKNMSSFKKRKGPSVRSKPEKAAIKASAPKEKKAGPTRDVMVDKWGCLPGSKNGEALAMFEKGATTSEVKNTIGGTFYNILKRCVEQGHQVEKTGSMVKLTHKDDLGKPSKGAAKTSKKPVAKKGKK